MAKKESRLFAIAGATVLLSWFIRRLIRRRNRMEFNGRVVIITGGSRGLGLVVARQLAAEGARLAILARDPRELESARQELVVRGAEVLAIPCHVGDRQQVEEAVHQVVQRFGRVDVLINNAGIIQVGPFEHMTQADFEEAMAVHAWGPLYTTWAVVGTMSRQGGGRIANITSIGGQVAVPHLLPYVVSKYASVGLSDGLRAELLRKNILVTTVIPGLMRTGSHVNAFFKGNHRQEYTWFSIFDALPVTSTAARQAARRIVSAIRYGDPSLVITPQARLIMIANNLFPNLVAAGLAWMNRLLPRPEPILGDVKKTGWTSQSRWSPSFLTRLSDRAVAENNELKGHPPLVMPED